MKRFEYKMVDLSPTWSLDPEKERRVPGTLGQAGREGWMLISGNENWKYPCLCGRWKNNYRGKGHSPTGKGPCLLFSPIPFTGSWKNFLRKTAPFCGTLNRMNRCKREDWMSKDRGRSKTGVDLGKDSIGKLLLRLSLPAILAQLTNALYSIINRMYLGNIPGKAI